MKVKLRCYWRVYRFFKSIRKAYAWFRTPNPLVGGLTPNDMISIGSSERLLEIITNQLAGNPPPDELKNWHWPFLRYNFNGDPEFECPHGVGHGGIHGCCSSGCCGHESYRRRIRTENP